MSASIDNFAELWDSYELSKDIKEVLEEAYPYMQHSKHIVEEIILKHKISTLEDLEKHIEKILGDYNRIYPRCSITLLTDLKILLNVIKKLKKEHKR
ncbi:MAG: hypothetical protein DRN30_05410 [Thermoplasmata archaeon]|nr:hypothetical protein [Euryarchaeota archaeon]RLF64519.1 MAG: hypothetical protein DRN30_05410 [Thermoplasmata archaeon]